MGNIISYLEEKGNHSFEELPFNEVDSLILSQLSYLDFQYINLPKNNFKISFSELNGADGDVLAKNTFFAKQNQILFNYVCNSRRFGTVKLGYYINNHDFENEKQFSAITFKLKKNLYYIAYRGTDESIVGWKEDFNLSFLQNIPAQKDAVSYYEKLSKWKIGKFILGGHSKGGNLAVFTALKSKKNAKRKILNVYNHDGPGFLPDVFSEAEYKTVSSLIHKTIPRSSIVGLLFEQYDDYSVVESNTVSFLQHNPFSWIVEEDKFVLLESVTAFSEYVKHTLNTWLLSLTPNERKEFVDHLYYLFQSSDIQTIHELDSEKIKKLLKNIHSLDSAKKKKMQEIINELIKILFLEMKSIFSKKLKRKEL